ncbi:MAG: hypothetical protein ACI8WB_005294, partial [Phenylobacterium sp.]
MRHQAKGDFWRRSKRKETHWLWLHNNQVKIPHQLTFRHLVMKFLDIRTDFAFKKVFGSKESKPRLISFLNSILDFDDNGKIADLTIADPYNIPKLKGMKDTYVDVKAELTDGT